MLLLYLFIAVVLVNCCYYLLFSKFSFSTSESPKKGSDFPVSVIVCAKNEAENLKKHIPLLLNQDYPTFELILINDGSKDETLDVLTEFSKKDSRIKIVDVKSNENFWGKKKYALTLGIKKAINTRLVFTDADCKPASKDWLRSMASQFSIEKQLILGYGGYQRSPGLLNAMIRFETGITAIQYFAYAIVGKPYMGVGRNLAYTSNLFYDNNGFMSHIQVASGDDDLFVHEAATKENTVLCYQPDAFTYSIPKKSWKKWLEQKKRHISTSKHYKSSIKILLGLYFLSNLSFWTLAIICFFKYSFAIVLTIFTLRLLVMYTSIGKGLKRLNESSLIPYIVFLEIFLVLFQMSIFISSLFLKNQRWK